MFSAGIDVGSTATKAVVFDGTMARGVEIPTGWNPKEAGEQAYREALRLCGLSSPEGVASVIGTGYGRISLPFIDRKVTEITCHARGASYLFPGTRTVIDIGGQDSKVIRLNDDGSVADFLMNDKCAAGTGRFLQVMTGVLDINLNQLGALAALAEPASISSMCAVFAESEIIGLLARGVEKEAIAAGIVASLAERIDTLARRLHDGGEITFTGGIARNRHICDIIGARIGVRLNVPEEPHLVGALGAALIGFRG